MILPAHDLIVLAGGAGRRMGGVDKAEVLVAGTRLLERVLAAAPGAGRRLVVGPVRPTDEPVEWCREHPPGGGPVPGLAAALPLVDSPYAVLLAVDMPLVDAAVVTRLLTAARGRDGAIGVDATGRDQPLLAAYDVAALRTGLAALGPLAGASMRSVLARLDVARVEVGNAGLDCDTWDDVAQAKTLVRGIGNGSASGRNVMTELDRWVQRLQEELGLDQDVVLDVGAVLDLARVAAHEVDRPAAPLTTFLVGYAAGRASGAGNPVTVEVLAARAAALAESWTTSA